MDLEQKLRIIRDALKMEVPDADESAKLWNREFYRDGVGRVTHEFVYAARLHTILDFVDYALEERDVSWLENLVIKGQKRLIYARDLINDNPYLYNGLTSESLPNGPTNVLDEEHK